MFAKRKNEPKYDNPANKVMNRILTYGLVVFVVYSLFTTGTGGRKHTEDESFNGIMGQYTPVNWDRFIRLRNELTGEQKLFYMNENYQTKLYFTAEQLENLKKQAEKSADGKIAVYDVMIISN